MITDIEKLYITEHYVNWKPGKFRYWQSLPQKIKDLSPELVESSKQRPAIMFIHGYGAMIEHWRCALSYFKGLSRLYAIDLLGFGFSEKLPGDKVNYSPELWARQVYDLLKYKNEEKVILVGHSFGGMVAARFAMDYPEMAEALVLVDSAGLPDLTDVERHLTKNNRPKNLDVGSLAYNAVRIPLLGEVAAITMAASSRWSVKTSLLSAYWNHDKVTDQLIDQFCAPLKTPGAAYAYLAVTRNIANFRLPLKPGDLKLPALLIWGEYDHTLPYWDVIPRWQTLLPQADAYVVSQSGHCPQDERPEVVNKRLSQFFESVLNDNEEEAA